MPALLLYAFATAIIIIAWRRWVQPISVPIAVTLALLPFCFTGKALLTGGVHGPIDLPFMSEPLKDYTKEFGIKGVHNGFLSDLYTQIIPWKSAVRDSLRNGEWPLWNPRMLCGDILASAAQPGVYDPINTLGLLIPLAASVTFGNAMTFFLAGFFAFAFARAIECDELSSLICAAGWMFCGGFAFFVGWPLGRAWSLLPFVMFAVRLVAQEASTHATIILTIAFVLLIAAGHPESILHIVAVGAAYGLFETLRQRAQAARAIAGSIVAGIVALLISAIFLLPFFAAVPETREHLTRTEMYATADFPTNPTVIGRRLANTFVPFWGGQPWRQNHTRDYDPTTGRVGSVIVALAMLAPALASRRRETWFFLGLLLISLCVGAEAPPFAHILHELPLFAITLNERLIVVASFAFCVLASIGVSALRGTENRRAAITVAAVCIILGLVTMFLWPVQEERGIERSLMGLLAVAELLPLAVLFIMLSTPVRARTVVITALALLLLQRYVEDGTIYPTLPSRSFYPSVPLIDYVRDRVREEPARVVGWHWAMIPNMFAVHGLDDPRGYEAMTFRRLVETYPLWAKPEAVSFNRVSDLSRPFLSMINTRFAITSKDAQPTEGWKIVAEDRSCRVMENSRAFPRAFIPEWIHYKPGGADILLAMMRNPDFKSIGWIQAPEYKPHVIANGRGTLRTRRIGRRFEIAATMEQDGWIIVSETAWNGWRAYLDGRRVRVHYANHAFLGIFVPAGSHKIRLDYLPEAFTRGRTITLGTVVVLFALAAGRRIRARAKRRLMIDD